MSGQLFFTYEEKLEAALAQVYKTSEFLASIGGYATYVGSTAGADMLAEDE